MDHDENEDNEQKLFSLKEAESARRELEPVLIEAMETAASGGARRSARRGSQPYSDDGRNHN